MFFIKNIWKKITSNLKNKLYFFLLLSEKTSCVFHLKHSKTLLSNCMFWHFSIKHKLLNFYGKISNPHILVPESHTLRWKIERPWNYLLIFLACHIFWVKWSTSLKNSRIPDWSIVPETRDPYLTLLFYNFFYCFIKKFSNWRK